MVPGASTANGLRMTAIPRGIPRGDCPRSTGTPIDFLTKWNPDHKAEYEALVAKRFNAADRDSDATIDVAELKTKASAICCGCCSKCACGRRTELCQLSHQRRQNATRTPPKPPIGAAGL